MKQILENISRKLQLELFKINDLSIPVGLCLFAPQRWLEMLETINHNCEFLQGIESV